MNDQPNTNEPSNESTETVAAPAPEVSPEAQAVAATMQAATPASSGKWYAKRANQIAIALLLFVIIVAGTVFVISGSDDADGEDTAATTEQSQPNLNLAAAIALIEGSVEYSTDGNTWQTAEGADTVTVGQYVRTLADSRAVVLLDDGSAIRLDQNSRIKLMASDAGSSEILLEQGQVYSRVVESESRVFAVITESERFEALGTAFKTQTASDKDSLEVYESSVKVESDSTEVKEGNQYDTDSKTESSIDLKKLQDDDFVQWNKEKDSDDDDFKNKLGVLDIDVDEPEDDSSSEPTPTPQPGATILASASATDDGVKVTWNNSGISANDGYKIVYDKSSSIPTYNVHSSQYTGAGSTSHFLDLDDGQTYFIRVCAYRPASSSCDSYSNTIQATAPLEEKEPVVAGAVTLSIDGDDIEWNYEGTAPHGFKILLASSNNPTYPANSIQYVGEGTDSTELPDKPAGTYYVRVCKYTDDANISGGCTDYSNEVAYTVSE